MFIRRVCGGLRIAICLCAAAAGPARAGTYSGTFAYDDDLQLIPVTLNGSQDVAISTRSFVAGGFAPVLSFFDPADTLLALDYGGFSGGCTTPDPATGFCWDAFISLPVLPAGTYTVALTEDDNLPNGPTLSDGFVWGTGQSNDFTGPEFLGGTGSFITVGGYQRSGDWALEIDANSAPEPAMAAPLCALALAALAMKRTYGRGGAR